MCRHATIVLLIVLGWARIAFAQPTPAVQPAASAHELEARAIAAACGALTPADGRPVPALSLAQQNHYRRLLLGSNIAHQRGVELIARPDAGGGEQGRAYVASALTQSWEAFLLAPTQEVAEGIVSNVRLLGEAADEYRCALVACLQPRTPDGESRVWLDAEQARCTSRRTPVGPTVARITLTGEALQAAQADTALVAEIRRDQAADTSVATTWQVPSAYQPRIEAALARFHLSRATTAPMPLTATVQRSKVGFAVPIGCLAAAAGVLVGAVVSTSEWSRGNAELAAANVGQSNGWPGQVEADTRNAALRAEILFPLAAALVGGAAATWFGLAPHQLTVTPTVAPHAFSVSGTLRF